jgi:hypothetical protein
MRRRNDGTIWAQIPAWIALGITVAGASWSCVTVYFGIQSSVADQGKQIIEVKASQTKLWDRVDENRKAAELHFGVIESHLKDQDVTLAAIGQKVADLHDAKFGKDNQ